MQLPRARLQRFAGTRPSRTTGRAWLGSRSRPIAPCSGVRISCEAPAKKALLGAGGAFGKDLGVALGGLCSLCALFARDIRHRDRRAWFAVPVQAAHKYVGAQRFAGDAPQGAPADDALTAAQPPPGALRGLAAVIIEHSEDSVGP